MSDFTRDEQTDPGESGGVPDGSQLDALDEEADRDRAQKSGPLAWFTKNSVAANIVMIFLLVVGGISLFTVKQEVFPEAELDAIVVQVPYPGASPEEVEEGVLLAVEESMSDLDNIKDLTSTALENIGVATVTLERGTDVDQALNDIKARIDRITSLPEDAERPNVFRAQARFEVLSMLIFGDASEQALRTMAERVRDDLLQVDDISFVELVGTRPYEISVEVPQAELRRHGLTLDEIAAAIRQASVDLPGGAVKTSSGEVLVRTTERRQRGHEFEQIVLISRPDGTTVTVGDIATVKDDFAETDQGATFNGKPAIMIRVFRSSDGKPLDVAQSVRDYIDENEPRLPPGVEMQKWIDWSVIYKQRIGLLVRNAGLGLILVLVILGLFLDLKLAFWVTLGIPISFIGAFVFLPSADVSINMISLFAFILVLGMVVDDAIVVGEAVYLRRQQGYSRLAAAISGVREVAVPVVFAIVTTILAYLPMLFVPGVMGKFFRVIPLTVIIVLLLSLVESLLILPAHLAHSKRIGDKGFFAAIHRRQQRFSQALERFVERTYAPLLHKVTKRRYLTLAIGLAFGIGSCGLMAGGHVETVFFPEVEGEVVIADAQLPYGVPAELSETIQERMVSELEGIFQEHGGGEQISLGIFAQTGSHSLSSNADFTKMSFGEGGTHLVEVAVLMVPAEQRSLQASELAMEWRKRMSDVAGLERLSFNFATGPSGGSPVHVEFSHPEYETTVAASRYFAERLQEFDGVYDINDGFEDGKQQLDYTLTPEARSLGLTEAMLASQLRASFFGAEAVRQQRGRDEVRTYVRLPRNERESEYTLERMVIRTPQGGEIPLSEAAEVERGRSFTEISRADRRRVVTVTAQVDDGVANAGEVNAKVAETLFPEMKAKFPDLKLTVGGEQESERETNTSLLVGMAMAVLGMYALLAIAFRSYSQPIIILMAIPFGVVGAIWGHLIFGYAYSMMSTMGVVALSGVVVNDSLILIVAVNRLREGGMDSVDATIAGGIRRFRPILLTSLTTFFGLMPMLLETDVQAKFLVPMAVSLGCGVMFATGITLLLVPAAYLVLEDARRGVSRAWKWYNREATETETETVGPPRDEPT